jgi:hypothetical protein
MAMQLREVLFHMRIVWSSDAESWDAGWVHGHG